MLQLHSPSGLHHNSPFDLHNDQAYRAWRALKLQNYPRNAQDLVVEIRDPLHLSAHELAAMTQRISHTNMAIFALPQAMDKNSFARFCAQFGLSRLDKNLCADDDGISELRVIPEGRAQEYIPYSNKPINWHTDGYYNAPTQLNSHGGLARRATARSSMSSRKMNSGCSWQPMYSPKARTCKTPL